MAENESPQRQKLPDNFAEDSEEGIADSWESAGDGALERQLDQRAAELRKEQERLAALQLAEAKEAAAEEEQAPPVFKILRRPESSGNLQKKTDNSLHHANSANSMKTLEEREKAYVEARMRIFGDAGPPINPSASNESLEDGQGGKEKQNSDGSPKHGRSSSSGSDSRKNSSAMANRDEGLTPIDLKDQPKSKGNSGEGKGKKSQKNKKSSYSGRMSGPKVVLDLTGGVTRPRVPPSPVVIPGSVAQPIRMPDMSRPPPPLIVRPPGIHPGPLLYQTRPPRPIPPHQLRYPPGSAPVMDPNASPYGCPPSHVARQYPPPDNLAHNGRTMQNPGVPQGPLLHRQDPHVVSFQSSAPKAQILTNDRRIPSDSSRNTSSGGQMVGIRIMQKPEPKKSDNGRNSYFAAADDR